MKKILALLLAAVMCLSLVACGGGSDTPETNGNEENTSNTTSEVETADPEDAIVGEWKATDGSTLVFANDGTGDFDGTSFTWKYDDELNCYTVASMITMNFNITTEDNIRFFELLGVTRYYHIDDYEKVLEAEKQAAVEEIYSYTEGRTKIEIGKSYDYAEGVTIEFLGASITNDGYDKVCIDAAITSESSITQERIKSTGLKTHYLRDNVKASWVASNLQWGENLGEYGGADKLEPGATVKTRACVYQADSIAVERISVMICCFEINGTEYYMDLSEYLK